VNEPESVPQDPYTRGRKQPLRTFTTRSDFDKLKKFLQLDRKVRDHLRRGLPQHSGLAEFSTRLIYKNLCLLLLGASLDFDLQGFQTFL